MVNTNVNKEQIIEINDAGSSVSFNRDCMKHCTETPDGFSIQLLNGMLLLYENIKMPNQTRKIIVHGINTYVNVKKIVINLRDYNKPVKVIA